MVVELAKVLTPIVLVEVLVRMVLVAEVVGVLPACVVLVEVVVNVRVVDVALVVVVVVDVVVVTSELTRMSIEASPRSPWLSVPATAIRCLPIERLTTITLPIPRGPWIFEDHSSRGLSVRSSSGS